MRQPVRIGLAGLGTVGGGVVRLLHTQAQLIASRCGQEVQLVAVSARDLNRTRDLPFDGVRVEANAALLGQDPDIDIVIEAIGGAEGIARAVVETALEHGKPVVTANKALLATHGLALAQKAEQHNTTIMWEAAVAGGIPIIHGVREGLAANNAQHIKAILNGTCNYILSQMAQTGKDFATCLHEAQTLGYAEADPRFDVEGTDSAHKLALLAALAWGTPPQFTAVETTGITHLTAVDIRFAQQHGYAIKLLAVANRHAAGMTLRVEPCFVPISSPLAQTMGVFNAVQIDTDYAGSLLWSGRGAGANPTASAIVSDMMDLIRGYRPPVFGVPAATLAPLPILPPIAQTGRFYLRLMVQDQAGLIAEITTLLESYGVHIDTIEHPAHAPLLMTTHSTTRAAMQQALAALAALPALEAPPQAFCMMEA